MKGLITGASWYVGAKIYDDLKEKWIDVAGTYHSNKLFDDLVQLDITDEYAVSLLIQDIQPEYIIHAAASTVGSWCEKNPEEAFLTNCKATEFLVNAANRYWSKMIFISSSAAVKPAGIYGRTKVESERIVKNSQSWFVIIRPSLILGVSPYMNSDTYFNKLFRNIREWKWESYDHVLEFKPTWLKHVSETVSCILKNEIANETIPVSVSESVTRYACANDIASAFDVKVTEKHYPHIFPNSQKDISKLLELNLPQYRYSEMIKGIIEEISEHIKK